MIRGHLLEWEGPPQPDGPTGSEPVDLRVTFESGVEEEVTSHLEMENCGTTAIYYSWMVHIHVIIMRSCMIYTIVYMYVYEMMCRTS